MQICSSGLLKRNAWDGQTCDDGKKLFDHVIKVFQEKVTQEVGSISSSDSIRTIVNKAIKGAEATAFMVMNNPESLKQKLIVSD